MVIGGNRRQVHKPQGELEKQKLQIKLSLKFLNWHNFLFPSLSLSLSLCVCLYYLIFLDVYKYLFI
jgi:hypothetical protein